MGTRNAVRPPSATAYYVALAGILFLLLLLCCYFLYFCVRRVKELSRHGLPEPVQSVRPPPPGAVPYPVQPGVRASASAMARLCQSPRAARSPAPTRPTSPRAHTASAQATRSNSLAPHSRAVHPHTTSPGSRAQTLPPPTILPPKTNQVPTIKPLHTKQNPTILPLKTNQVPKSPKNEVTRRIKSTDRNVVARKHLSAPPQIVVDTR